MKQIKGFIQLIRFPNLFFIALTQCLFYFIIVRHISGIDSNHFYLFILLVTASVLIAAAGYIINDYFDLKIDRFNKPEKVVIDKLIKRRWAIVWHLFLSSIGLMISLYVSYRLRLPIIVIGNFLTIILLWIYSTNLKQSTLFGNFVIAILSAWVVFVVYFFAGGDFNNNPEFNIPDENKLMKFMFVYAGFAFISTLIREALKDLEDMHGDAKEKCKTMPIIWGVQAAKMYCVVWSVVMVASLILLALYSWKLDGKWLSIYIFLLIILPMVLVIYSIKNASKPKDYHQLSNYLKLIMLTGILSMLFFI